MGRSVAATGEGVLQAVRQHTALSGEGVLEYLFNLAFKGLVYPQIWEDPELDLEALAITPSCHVVAIASGGCNVLSYLLGDPARVTAIDLNPVHVALNKLKRAAALHLPSWEAFYAFLGAADDPVNVTNYWRYLAPKLDTETRVYWEGRPLPGIGRRRVSMFADNIYRHGLLGRFVGLGHAVARLYGVDVRKILQARSLEEQRAFFNSDLAPLFDKKFIRWITAMPVSLYGLGIPPAQYQALAGGSEMAAILRHRVERLACGFSLAENYFAWQAFGRAYCDPAHGPVPPYLRRDNYTTIRARARRIEVVNGSLSHHLGAGAGCSVDRFVLLDAQDWMSPAQLDALWSEITRTARPGARVIFRTAAADSPLPGNVRPDLLRRWRYEGERSGELTARDRSAIYGGFHLYTLENNS